MPFLLNPYGFAAPLPSFVGPLDGLTTDAVLAVAFGHRMISGSDPDIAIIRNVSTSGTQSFKATTGAFGDEVTSFLAGSEGRYATVYDQINGASFVESSLNSGAKAATAGVLETLGTGLAGLSVINALASSAVFVQPQPFTIFLVVNLSARGSGSGVVRFGNGLSAVGFLVNNWAVRLAGGATANTGVPVQLGADLVVRVVVDGASSHIAINNASPTVFNPGTAGIGAAGALNCTIGWGVSSLMNGKVGFVGLWSGRKDDGAIDGALAGVW